MNSTFERSIFSIKDEREFNNAAIELFRFQAEKCAIYSEFIRNLGIDPATISDYHNIPFIPITFFRDHDIYCSDKPPVTTFLSSGTTGSVRSHHNIADTSLYEKSYTKAFNLFYGDPSQYAFMALLPSYADREGSSLVHMVKGLMSLSGNSSGGFFLDNYDALLKAIDKSRKNGLRPLLIGVTFALLDLAEYCSPDLGDVIIMETGGMKGRRKEIIREELHSILCNAFNVEAIHSEYGMTELLSQAYSHGSGLFTSPAWMKILIRDSHDPLSHSTEDGSQGGISVIDLANIWSCAFIATSDLGRLHNDGKFEVQGRFDNADIRGCNLLINT
jgi:hypothetical protein